MLKLMYITNNPEIARIAEDAGVERIFVDMEYIGKSDRQGGMDTVQSQHTLEDIANVRKELKKSELLVRCNPIHGYVEGYGTSEEEINSIISSGADIIMLPYFKTVSEVQQFVKIVNGRVKTMLLFETPESVDHVDEILAIDGINEVFIGLNDLSLGYGKKFMFELLTDGTVENLCRKFSEKGLPYGFGGIASVGQGLLPAEYVIAEHYRLGSTCVILSRSFCDVSKIGSLEEAKELFAIGLSGIRRYESFYVQQGQSFFNDNTRTIKEIIAQI